MKTHSAYSRTTDIPEEERDIYLDYGLRYAQERDETRSKWSQAFIRSTAGVLASSFFVAIFFAMIFVAAGGPAARAFVITFCVVAMLATAIATVISLLWIYD